MSTVVEIVCSRKANISLENPSIELMFRVFQDSDDAAVRALLEAELPPTYSITSAFFGTITLVIQSYELDERDGNGIWTGSATYGRRQPRKTGECWMSFDGTGGQQHITTSQETIKSYSPLGDSDAVFDIPDFGGAIGVNNDIIEGCDITIPVFKFVIDFYPPTAMMTQEYISTIVGLTGTINLNSFIWCDPREVLFLGPTGQPRSFDDWELRFHFIQSPNVSDLSIGQIENIVKDGWDYLWIRFQNAISQNTLVKQPAFAYVERVYSKADFAQFQFPATIQGLAP